MNMSSLWRGKVNGVRVPHDVAASCCTLVICRLIIAGIFRMRSLCFGPRFHWNLFRVITFFVPFIHEIDLSAGFDTDKVVKGVRFLGNWKDDDDRPKELSLKRLGRLRVSRESGLDRLRCVSMGYLALYSAVCLSRLKVLALNSYLTLYPS